MTFPARLTELLDAIKNEKDPIKRFAYVQQMDALLVNKAEALRDLVVAAKEYQDAQQEWAKYRLTLDNAEANYSDPAPDEKLFMAAVLRVNKAEHALSEALANLEEQ